MEAHQPVDQAGFRKDFSCDDHLFTVMLATEKAAEWNTHLWIAAVDFKKAFDSVEHKFLWESLREHGVGSAYINVFKDCMLNREGSSVQTGPVVNFRKPGV